MTIVAIGLWALVIALGLQVGAGIFETRVLVPLWASDPPASLTTFHSQAIRPDSRRRLWIFLSPATTVICVFNLVLALSRHDGWREWWLAAVGCGLAVMVATFAYFVLVLLYLSRVAARPPETVASTIRRWIMLNYVRAAVLTLGWLAALRAFAEAI